MVKETCVSKTKIVVEELGFHYQGGRHTLEALRGVNFACYEREMVAIVGPSGCGKSTLLSIIAGLKEPTSGRVFVDEQLVTQPPAGIGVIFQKSTLLPWRSVRENVELGLEIRGVPLAERRGIALELIKKYGLSGFDRKYPHALSGGMQKRVALIQTLAFNPDILLLDEAFASLDAQTRLLVEDEFLRICREMGKTVVMVTHDISEAISMADRVIVLSARPGRVKADHKISFAQERTSVLEVSSLPEYSQYFRTIWEELEVSGISFTS